MPLPETNAKDIENFCKIVSITRYNVQICHCSEYKIMSQNSLLQVPSNCRGIYNQMQKQSPHNFIFSCSCVYKAAWATDALDVRFWSLFIIRGVVDTFMRCAFTDWRDFIVLWTTETDPYLPVKKTLKQMISDCFKKYSTRHRFCYCHGAKAFTSRSRWCNVANLDCIRCRINQNTASC